MTLRGIIPLALAASLGCMHRGAEGDARSPTVSDADVGRLGPEQEGLVNEARQARDAAKDALSRTSLRLQQARNEVGTANADREAAAADRKVADARQKVADDSRAPEALEEARRLRERAEARAQIAALHVDYAGKLVDERTAEVQAAERQVAVADARVEWSKLQALEQAKNPAATKYDARSFERAVSDAQAELDEAAEKARSSEAQATAARQRWEDAKRRLQGDGGGDAGGTGSGK